MNPKEFVHNTAYSVQYKHSRSLPLKMKFTIKDYDTFSNRFYKIFFKLEEIKKIFFKSF